LIRFNGGHNYKVYRLQSLLN